MKWKEIVNTNGVTYYRISEYGHVYSLRKRRLMKEGVNGVVYPYRFYVIEVSQGIFKRRYTHRLVHEAFIGPIPEGYEVDHMDMEKANNHYTNLEAVTQAENMRRARDKKTWYSDRSGFTHSTETKTKMSAAKFKPVLILDEDKLIECCQSIEDAAQYLDTYRKKVYRALISGKVTRFKANSYTLQYKPD